MTRTSPLVTALLSLLCSTAFAASLPGQHISAHASVSYCSQSEINASACVDFVDQINAATQSASPPSTAIVETSEAPVSAGPAIVFVAPDSTAPLYFTSTRSFYSGPSLVGKRIKLAGRLDLINGVAYIDDGGTIAVLDPSRPGVITRLPVCVALRTDLISSLPADGSLITVQGVVRMESNGQPTLLPLANSGIIRVQ